MKLKIIALSIGLFLTIFSRGISLNDYSNITNDIQNQNVVSNEVVDNIEIIEDSLISLKQEQFSNTTNSVEEVKEEPTEKEVEQEIPKETLKTTKSQNNKTSNITETIAQTEVQETPKAQETVNTNPVEIPIKAEEPQQQVSKPITESDLEYWCVGGGCNHVSGNAANEHGYYSTWDEANQAFEAYTAGWSSVQYKINQCACGLYYFWAIQ
ncbi:MAG: hypothetical protein K1W33_00715 [Clostridia bacterium]